MIKPDDPMSLKATLLLSDLLRTVILVTGGDVNRDEYRGQCSCPATGVFEL